MKQLVVIPKSRLGTRRPSERVALFKEDGSPYGGIPYGDGIDFGNTAPIVLNNESKSLTVDDDYGVSNASETLTFDGTTITFHEAGLYFLALWVYVNHEDGGGGVMHVNPQTLPPEDGFFLLPNRESFIKQIDNVDTDAADIHLAAAGYATVSAGSTFHVSLDASGNPVTIGFAEIQCQRAG